MISEAQFRIVERLESSHRAMSRLLGDKFPERVKPYVEALTEIAVRENLDTLRALSLTLERLQEQGDDGHAQVMFCAAAAEIAKTPDENAGL